VRNRKFQMQQYVFAKESIKDRITNVEKFAENTGFFHVFPNKGGLRVSFLLDQTSLAFVSCHLTAHEVRRILIFSPFILLGCSQLCDEK
jgi:hypothetical protein